VLDGSQFSKRHPDIRLYGTFFISYIKVANNSYVNALTIIIIIGSDVTRHGLGPKQKYTHPKRNEAHLPFWAWAYVFCFINIIVDQLKEPAAGDNYCFVSKMFVSNYSQN